MVLFSFLSVHRRSSRLRPDIFLSHEPTSPRSVQIRWRIAMRKTALIITLLLSSAAFAADNPIDRWAKAVGGRDKVAAVKCIYREATIEVGGFKGTIKVWHTA